MIEFSVIIPAYNRAKIIGRTIQSLIEQTIAPDTYEILVCDNNSSDNTQEVVQSFFENAKGVQVRYYNEKRQGVHFARNSTAQKANGQYLYFTDDDMIAESNTLEEFSKWVKIFPNVKVFGGKVLPKWENTPPFGLPSFLQIPP